MFFFFWCLEVIFVQNQSKLISSEKKDVEEKVTLKNKLIIQVEEYETGEQNKSKKIETKEEKRKIEIIKEQINLQQNDKIGEKEKEKIEKKEETRRKRTWIKKVLEYFHLISQWIKRIKQYDEIKC